MGTTLKSFTPASRTISRDIVVEGDAWLATCTKEHTFELFEIPNPGIEDCTVLYRARVKTSNLTAKAYLEMWCRVSGRGEFFSKGLKTTVHGTSDWTALQIPFYLKKGEMPDLIRLNLVVVAAGWFRKKPISGRIWIKKVELAKEPLPRSQGGRPGGDLHRLRVG